MIIEDPTDPAEIGYDDERILMIGDWWQKPHSQLENETLSSVGFDWKGDSILTNGKGLFQGACSSPGHSLEVVTVDRNRRYRFRIINTGTLHQLAFRIAQHRMHIVEVEGQLVEPLEVDYLELSPGQRYSVLVTTDQSPGDYWMNSVPRYLPMDNVTGPSILRYVGGVETLEAFDLPVASSLPSFPLEKNNWVTAQLTSKFSARRPMPSQPDLTLVFEIGSSINNVSFAPPAPGELPLLEYAYQRRLPANQASRWIDLGNNTVVDIVLQAIVNDVGICDSHPWHMHGHGFWELGSGSGKFEDGLAETPAAPVFRDTSVLYAYVDPEEQGRLVEGTPCGWRHIRMLTNNPGLWALHCHMTVHVMKGLAVAFGHAGGLIRSVGSGLSAGTFGCCNHTTHEQSAVTDRQGRISVSRILRTYLLHHPTS
ncbi:Cupredoxin [Polychytrium aggregatum]|uniref:Cupredoxin n=1 Tax=Polychytrium aggregatum TaxID=110093 RepID=UPI0022FEC80A|nr:Cupredoxin [Polychytrium aggregatum]KAI9208440.1 Cupredoxin [Polychytrium aggregatum]